ncbi:hypothetical protein [Persephonella sp.]|uniref:hypothetical protein n=1 Tax=Persephonella sp. TaxID=2060922 RepID=UPI002618643B|nr:hypothetical protein [Persephonella sp.]
MFKCTDNLKDDNFYLEDSIIKEIANFIIGVSHEKGRDLCEGINRPSNTERNTNQLTDKRMLQVCRK